MQTKTLRKHRIPTLLAAGAALVLAPASAAAQRNCPELRGRLPGVDARGPGVSAAGGLDVNASGGLGVSGGVGTAGAVDAWADLDARGELAVAPPVGEADLRVAADARARARVQIDAGQLAAALPDLELAFVRTRDVTVLGDLGLALQAAGRIEESWLALHRFRFAARAAYEPVRARIDAALGALQAQLGGLLIESGAPGARVVVRGMVVATLPMTEPIYLSPGDVTVTVRAPGMLEARVNARVAAGAVARARADLVAVAGARGGVDGGVDVAVRGGVPGVGVNGAVRDVNVRAPGVGLNGGVPGVGVSAPNGNIPAPHASAPNLWPWVVGIGGLVVLGGAIAATVVHGNLNGALDANLCGRPGASPMCPGIQSDLGLTDGLQIAGYIVATAAVAAGVVLFFVLRTPAPPAIECPQAARATPHPRVVVRAPGVTRVPSLTCGPGVMGEGGGVACAGMF